jgi:hypothetical protein
MSYTKEEREEIAKNIREFMKQPKKDKFEEVSYGGMKVLHRRQLNMTHYDRDWLETVAQDNEKREKSPPPLKELSPHHGEQSSSPFTHGGRPRDSPSNFSCSQCRIQTNP